LIDQPTQELLAIKQSLLLLKVGMITIRGQLSRSTRKPIDPNLPINTATLESLAQCVAKLPEAVTTLEQINIPQVPAELLLPVQIIVPQVLLATRAPLPDVE
jgi:hypothetical protein